MSKYLSRKDICALLECGADFLRKNEKRLGLDLARCDIRTNEARYFRSRVIAILLEKGLIEAEK